MKKRTKLKKEWTTHMPLLIKAVQISNGPVLELGSGLFSTPLLHWLCAEHRRQLRTFEDNPEYYKFAKKFYSRNHAIKLVTDWDKINIDKHWSVVLIDHPVERRVKEAIRLKDKADYIILHDTNDPVYGYDKLWPYFKYRHDWKFCRPWTTVVSNSKDLKGLFHNLSYELVQQPMKK